MKNESSSKKTKKTLSSPRKTKEKTANGLMVLGDKNTINYNVSESNPTPKRKPSNSKPKKISQIIIVALITLIGTLVTALLNSPIVYQVLFETPSSTSTINPPSEVSVTPIMPTETGMPNEILYPDLTYTPAPTSTPAELPIGSAQVSEIDGMVSLIVPSGEFIMGSDSPGASSYPKHSVFLNSFWIDATEVTSAMYRLCVESRMCKIPNQSYLFDDSRYDQRPIVFVSWYDAETYCNWAGRRLPSEAEWEKAARGIDGRVYPWGDGINNEFSNYENNLGYLTDVGSFPKGISLYGAFDMSGNAWEWVIDWYDPNYYSISPVNNPLGPNSGDTKVVRGGSWASASADVSSLHRGASDPKAAGDRIGFRCVRDVAP